MSDIAVNVLLGLGTALLGYLFGRLWRTLVVRRRYWRARHFWQPVVDGHFQIVISRFAVDGFREPTGVVGGGDAIANRLLGDLFLDIGLERPKSVYVDESELDRSKNLIVLGGRTENRVADEALSRIRPGLSVTDPGPGIDMQVRDLSAGAGPDGDGGDEPGVYIARPALDHMTDYGVIVRARSPFNPERAVVVISGAYGYGTWAGVQVSQSADFLQRCAELDAESRTQPPPGLRPVWSLSTRLGLRKKAAGEWAEIECLYKVDVIDRRPHACEILVCRRIAPVTPARESSAPRSASGRS